MVLEVVADVRTRDVAAGGQGAPLVPLLDRLLAEDAAPSTAFLNLGGIANVTAVALEGAIQAFDSGPGNALIDAAMSTHPTTPAPYDADARGSPGRRRRRDAGDPVDRAHVHPSAPKTTGKELSIGPASIEHRGGLVGDDLVATLTAFTDGGRRSHEADYVSELMSMTREIAPEGGGNKHAGRRHDQR